MKKKYIAMFFMLVVFCLFIWAQNSDEIITGEQIMDNVYNRQTPDDLKGNLKMILENNRGDQRVREINQFIKNTEQDEKKIMFFTSPADVANTSFMNWSYEDENVEDSQWIYLPAIKKIKRISSSSSSDYFMGSDFTYDDLGNRKPSEDTHTLLRSEVLDNSNCYVVQSIPVDEDSMYSKTITWVLPDSWVGVKKEFYDEDGDLLKELDIQKLEEIKGYWIIAKSLMTNVQKDHTTLMELSDLQVNTGLQDKIFTERIMVRGI
ncbi:MAG: outer membrane lipoprotein-sorting protein [Sphaerochaetaceae bacterium]